MASLESLLDAAGCGPLEAAIFGTTEAAVVAEVLSSLAFAATGAKVCAGRWYSGSVAAVAEVALEGGERVVVRAYQPSTDEVFIEGVVRVQRHLAGTGFACAHPIGDPVVVGGVLGRVESVLADPGPRRFAFGEISRSAAGLAEIVERCSTLDPRGLDSYPMLLPDDGLYPTPHSPLFDFDATAPGAEWIDGIAVAARRAMTDRDSVIGHGDWSARNVRLDNGGLVAVYDWESLQHAPESVTLGIAAAMWRSLGQPGDDIAPSAFEIQRYIDVYGRVRPRPLSKDQLRAARAAAVFALAYTARCEHALDPGTRTARASARLRQEEGLGSLLT